MPMNKIYCGNGKMVEFGDGGYLIAVTLDMDMLNKHQAEFGFKARQSGKAMIKIKVCKNRDGADKYDNTHYVEVDQWKPNGGSGGNQAPTPPAQAPANQAVPPPSNFEDDIPF